ncbi:TIM barrel protein [Lysobacter korlensis]|uniref:TIM barrel protein n=1 Tax=Lysobacter korlensis TaxID=553636 RepID=A0ABV6RX76_9GAMM
MRIAGAPISWGVCEVPGWGHQLDPQRVLTEMARLGLTATEFGPDGWLPRDTAERARLLADANLSPVGAFVPVVVHDRDTDPLPDVERALEGFRSAGGDVLVLAAASGADGYDARPLLNEEEWETVSANLDRIAELAADYGVKPSLHPHVGTMVETREEVERVLEHSSIPLCLDTGHLLIGGTDPAELVTRYADRVNHVHAKDVRASIAAQVRSGELTYTEAVRRGIYAPLGQGDVDFAAIVRALDGAGYDGWYVLEQDTILPGEPQDEGPVGDVQQSLAYLRGLE